MIYLALSIICSTIIVLIFRAFINYRIDSLQAIVINYITCAVIGLGATSGGQLMKLFEWSGLGVAVFLGLLFIGLFYLIARTTQEVGVTAASVAQKLSFVFPVVAGILLFDESFHLLKLIGFVMAVLAVLFISARRDGVHLKGSLRLPLLVFVGSGICDTTIKLMEAHHLALITKATFTVVLFGTASLAGLLWMIARSVRTGKKPDLRSIAAGVALGVPNYGSIYFLLSSLQQSGLEASQVFPINNVGIILVSAASAWLLFNERLNRLQAAGLGLALASIFVLM